jgi:hypothetical protein
VIRRSWRTHLKAATTQQEVLTVVGRFLGEWTPQEVDVLPPGVWPRPPASKADIVAHAVALGQIHARPDLPARGLAGVQEMLLFFTHAAVRASHLAAIAAADTAASLDRSQPHHGAMKPVADEET